MEKIEDGFKNFAQFPPYNPKKIELTSIKNPGGKHSLVTLNILKSENDFTNSNTMMREMNANFLDQLGESNQDEAGHPSYKNIKYINGRQRIAFYNKTHLLGEIIHTDNPAGNQFFSGSTKIPAEYKVDCASQIRFINYGVVIEHPLNVLAIGNSAKVGRPNQHGRHAEGLKFAIMELLKQGCGVEIYCPTHLSIEHNAYKPNQYVLHRWRFSFSSEHQTRGTVSYTSATVLPTEVYKGRKDQVRFEVVILYPRKSISLYNVYSAGFPNGLKWRPEDHVITPLHLFTDKNGPDDHGQVLLDAKMRGNVYVSHFFVKNYDKLLWSYDIYADIGRDRNTVEHNKLLNGIKSIWNQEIVHASPAGKIFFETLFMNQVDESVFEVVIMNWLSVDSKIRLIKMFKNQFCGVYPIISEEYLFANEWLFGTRFVIFTSYQMSVLSEKYKGPHLLKTELETPFLKMDRIKQEQYTLDQASVCKLLQTICKVEFTCHFDSETNVSIRYMKTPENSLLLNWLFFKKMTFLALMDYIVHVVLFRLNIDTVQLLKNPILVVAAEPPKATAEPPPPPQKKRDREEEIPKIRFSIEPQGAPEGFKYIKTWSLVPK